MTDHHHLATTNAPRRCGGCGAAATVYDHALGFRCGACGDYPAGRRPPDTGATMPTDDTERTQVGHCKQDATDVYVGRGPSSRDMTDTRIGDRGWLGNPYPVKGDVTREDSIRYFRRVFETRLETDAEFRDAVADLAGKTLGCWCQRLDDDGPPCHAEVIAEHADRLAQQTRTRIK